MLEASPEFVAFGVESWGIVASSTIKEWEGATTHCVGYVRVAAGKPIARGVCKWFDTAGNTASGEFDMPALASTARREAPVAVRCVARDNAA